MTNEFDIIEPPALQATLNGAPLTLRPLTVGQLPAMMRALQGLELSLEISRENVLELLPALIAENGEAIIEAAAIATRQSREAIEASDLSEFVALVAGVIEINSDFFVQKLLPTLTRHVERLRLRSAGATPSNH